MQHTFIIKNKPVLSGKASIPDGALCGNGDIGVILGNSEAGLRLHLSKADFWCASEFPDDGGGIKAVGNIDITIPTEMYENYYAEQRMDTGEIYCRFSDGDNHIDVLIAVCAVSNNILIKISNNFGYEKLKVIFKPIYGEKGVSKEFKYKSVTAFSREFNDENVKFTTKLTAGIKKISSSVCGDICYMVSMNTNHDSDDFESCGLDKLDKYDISDFEKMYSEHLKWWKNFYSASSFTTDDEELELNWYASQYILAICSRNIKFPPGLYGNFITIDNVNWKGDYHLNYNYQAPFYGLCTSNHVELTDCYAAPLFDFVERGKENAKNYLGCKGIFYPVGMGPKGIYSEYTDNPDNWERMFLGQKSNAIHSATIMIMRWNSTGDIEYAKNTLYPYFREIADFWESYLVKENGKYVVLKDAVHEIPYYKRNFNPEKYKKYINDKNSLLTLGLLHMFFDCIVDMSAALNADEEKRKKWIEISENLSEFPTFRKRFKKVFRLTSKGRAWNDTNSLCIQHIYPCGQIGLNSDKKLLKTAKNTFLLNDRWFDSNATSSIYPCAARLEISPDIIIRKLKENYKRFLLANGLFSYGGGCIENNSVTAATLNEMVLQSYQGIIKIFPNWSISKPCEFKNLRADSGFLVSSQIADNDIKYVSIFSENDSRMIIENPYCSAKIYYKGKYCIKTDKVLICNMEHGTTLCITKG